VARETGKLKAKQVEKWIRAGEPRAHYDGRGLRLEIKGPNSAYWVSRYQIDGAIRYMGLGSAFEFSLVEARKRNTRLVRQKLADGIDPLLTRRAERAARRAAAAKELTFDEACRRFLEQHGGKWESRKHRAQWEATLRDYASPILGEQPVGQIGVPLILKVLEQLVPAKRGHPAGPLWMVRPETANRLRGRAEAILDWCKARGHRQGDNPAAWSIIGKVLPQRGAQEHHAALPYKDIPAFMKQLRAEQGVAARALEFLILTAARSQEVREARRSEFDLDAAVWTVPPERMKMRREHRVPLSERAVALLRRLPTEEGTDFMFIGTRPGKPMGHTTLSNIVNRRMGRDDATVHGMRSAFRDFVGERTSFPNDVCEAALAHVKGKTVRAYARGDLFDKRRALMQAWSDFCHTPPVATGASVTPIRDVRHHDGVR
jgi:integrase